MRKISLFIIPIALDIAALFLFILYNFGTDIAAIANGSLFYDKENVNKFSLLLFNLDELLILKLFYTAILISMVLWVFFCYENITQNKGIIIIVAIHFFICLTFVALLIAPYGPFDHYNH